MNRYTLVLGCLALPLAACGGGAEQEAPAAQGNAAGAPTANIVVPAGNYEEQLRTMPEASRNATFIRAIRDAGRECQGVTASAARAPIQGAPAWTATCQDGRQWIILLGNDGVVQVTHEEELRAGGVQP